ncbi:MAG: glucose-6-phosphate isomerase [Hyphomicrobiaceae bacterium]|jgi:glucose-6-phosphate isomerase
MSAAASSSFSLDLNGFFEHMIGAHGFASGEFEAEFPRVSEILVGIASARARGELPFHDLPRDQETIRVVGQGAAAIRERHDTLLVLGIGGSALGTKAVLEAVPDSVRENPGADVDVVVVDNIDPTTLGTLLDRLDPSRTAVNVISKSGGTAETWAQFLIVRQWLARAGRWQDHTSVTTDIANGPLRAMARDEGLAAFSVPDGVGGRFSVLSAVGLLPLAVAGVDINALCQGAIDMDATTAGTDAATNPAALHALGLWMANTRAGAAMHVLMPYSDRLGRLAEWYAQLWAESIGKRVSLQGEIVEVGQTPVRSVGATDQHSQVQLYVEGPRDKVVTFVRVEDHGRVLEIPRDYADIESVGYLGGHDLGGILNMEQRATELALVEAERPTTVISLSQLDTAAVGRLFHFFEVQTLVMGALLGIDPLDQPGVEAGKRMTFAMAGRAGYERDAERVRAMFEKKRGDLVLD